MNTDHYVQRVEVQHSFDLVEFASKLTALTTSSAGVAQLCSTQDRIVRFLGNQLEQLEDAPGMDVILVGLSERLGFTKELLQAERQHNEYAQAATAAQVQMVCSDSTQN